jgi:myosin heavy subunit
LEFNPSKKQDGGSQISSQQQTDCKRIAQLLGLSSADALDAALCFRENIVSGEVFMIPLDPQKALDQRDALSKYIYGKVFELVVTYVNSSLFRGRQQLGRNIGVLDIFGFEVFKENSFEQLCESIQLTIILLTYFYSLIMMLLRYQLLQ